MFPTAYLLQKKALSEVNKHTGTLNTQLTTTPSASWASPPCPEPRRCPAAPREGWMRSRDGWAGLALLLLLLLPTGCRHTSLLPLPDSILGKQVAVLLSQPSFSPQLVFPRSFSCGLSGQSSLRIAFLSTAVPADPSDPWPRLCCSALQSVLPFPGSPVPAPAPVSVTGKGGLCPSRVLPARRDGERLFVLGERQKEAAGAAAGRGSFGQGSLPVPGAHSLG